MKKIILDCDAGVDDALAILLGVNSNKINFYGITTVHGNSPLPQTTINVCRILDYLNLDIPVAKGADKPLKLKKINAENIHGKDGLGDSNLLPKNSSRKLDVENACDFILNGIKNGVKTLVATGPLTNIALAIKKNKKIMNRLEELIIMGGAINMVGNIDSISEFNFYADPHAADYIFRNLDVPIILVPLNVTHKVIFTPEDKNNLKDTSIAKLAKSIIQKYQKAYLDSGYGGNPLHDSLAMGYVINPSFLKLTSSYIKIELEGKHTRGVSILEQRPWMKIKPNVKVALEVNSKSFLDYFKNTLSLDRK